MLFIVLFCVTVFKTFILASTAYCCTSTWILIYVLFIFLYCHQCNSSLKYYLFSWQFPVAFVCVVMKHGNIFLNLSVYILRRLETRLKCSFLLQNNTHPHTEVHVLTTIQKGYLQRSWPPILQSGHGAFSLLLGPIQETFRFWRFVDDDGVTSTVHGGLRAQHKVFKISVER